MSRIKNMSRGGWMVMGVVVALLLGPTAAGAATLYNGIIGTSGHRADVTATGQFEGISGRNRQCGQRGHHETESQ